MFEFEGQKVTLSVTDDLAALEAEWVALERECAPSAYQRFAFVNGWAQNVAASAGVSPRVLRGGVAGRTVLLAPLAVRHRPLPLVVPLSDSHTNLNGGLFARGLRGGGLAEAALALMPEAEGFEACCMRRSGAERCGDRPVRSVHDAYVANVGDGFAAFMARNSGKRKRKKHRRSTRNFELAGGWRVERVDLPASLEATLGEAWEWMAARFARDGIVDPFAPPQVRRFFLDTCVACLADERPALGLWRLVVGSDTAAIMAAGFGGTSYAPMFTTYRMGGVEGDSPGEFLIYELCEMVAAMGCREFDLGRGREPYKVSWTDGAVPLYDIRIGRSARAKAYLGAREIAARAKRRVRDDQRLWAIAKRIRALRG